jgi:putative FmdB family regulatory protein
MPTYEYKCKSCGHSFEIVQSMRDDGLTECPECGGELRKVFAAPAISFKGSGFYATDHRKKGSSSSSEKSEKTEKKDDKKADAKPDTGSDAGAKSQKADQKTDRKSEKKSETKPAASSGGSSSSSKAKD